MAEQAQLVRQDVDWGWVVNWFDRAKLTKPSGLQVTPSVSFNHPWSYYEAGGLDAAYINTGVDRTKLNANIPGDRQAALTGRFFNDVNGNKPTDQYTQQDCDNAARYWVSILQSRFVVSDTNEEYAGAPAIGTNYNEAVWVMFSKSMGQILTQAGKEYYMDYAGSVYCAFRLGNANWLKALRSDADALAYLKTPSPANTQDGGEYSLCPYWRYEMWKYGCHTLVNQYFRASTDEHSRLAEFTSACLLARMAMRATGASKKIMLYTYMGYNEGLGKPFYTAFWRKQLNATNYHVAAASNHCSHGYGITSTFFASFDLDVLHDWEVQDLYGYDTTRVWGDFKNSDGVYLSQIIGDRQGIVECGKVGWQDQNTQTNAAYPEKPLGILNTIYQGVTWASQAEAQVGSKEWGYPTITMNGQQFTPGPGNEFIYTTLANGLPWTRYGYNASTGRWWVYMHQAAGKVPVTVTLSFAGISRTYRLLPGFPKFILSDGNSNA